MALTRVGQITLGSGEAPGGRWSGIDTTSTPHYGYFLVDTIPGTTISSKLVKVDLSTFTRVGVLDLGALCVEGCGDFEGGAIYIIKQVSDYAVCVIKVSLSSFTVTAISEYMSMPHSLMSGWYDYGMDSQICHSGNYVYTAVEGYGSTIYKLNKSNLSTALAVGQSYNPIGSMIVYGNTLLRGCLYAWGGVSAVRLSDLVQVSLYIPSDGSIYRPFVYNDKLYALIIRRRNYVSDYKPHKGEDNLFYRFDLPAFGNATLLNLVNMPEPSELIKDPYTTFAYVISFSTPATIKKIDIITMEVVDTIVLDDDVYKDFNPSSMASESSATDSNLYLYFVDNDGDTPSDLVKVSDTYPEGFATIEDLQCLDVERSINVSWNTVQRGVTRFRIWRSVNGVDYSNIVEVDGSIYSFVDTLAYDELIISYKVEQEIAGIWQGDCGSILEVQCSWHPWSPCPPIIFKAIVESSVSASISWKYLTSGCAELLVDSVTEFDIYRSVDGGAYSLLTTIMIDPNDQGAVGGDITNISRVNGVYSFINTGLSSGHLYSYYGVSVNPFRESSNSKIATITF
jgi:hypothetical protein